MPMHRIREGGNSQLVRIKWGRTTCLITRGEESTHTPQLEKGHGNSEVEF